MTEREFLNAVGGGNDDLPQLLLDMLAQAGASYCVIGGLAVNAYAEPVVSLDLDIVIAGEGVERLCDLAASKGLSIERFEHSINLSSPESDLRIQIQTDGRYQAFIARSEPKDVLGYRMNAALPEDVLQGKIWACSDQQRRRSKRQKDLADILRLIETYPELEKQLPEDVRERLR
ncbi:MAG: hypothetical protein JW959_05000 [Pirellulales bacterium]|nr:hypothetical protein [Pirellulales bacterium]